MWRASGSAGVPPAGPRVSRGPPDVALRSFVEGVVRFGVLSTFDGSGETPEPAGGTPALPKTRRPALSLSILARWHELAAPIENLCCRLAAGPPGNDACLCPVIEMDGVAEFFGQPFAHGHVAAIQADASGQTGQGAGIGGLDLEPADVRHLGR